MQRPITEAMALSRNHHPDASEIPQIFDAERAIAGMSEEEIAELKAMLLATPADPFLHLFAALVLERHGQHAASMQEVQHALQLGLHHWRLFWYIARQAAKLKDVALTEEFAQRVLASVPEFWYARELPKHARGYYSQMRQDEVIESFFSHHLPKHKTFVEVGAFDGVHYSNVRRLVEAHGWQGICIEPVTENFRKLEQSYQGFPVRCLQLAISDTPGEAQLNVSRYPHLPDWGSDVAEHRTVTMPAMPWKPDAVVRVETLNRVLEQHSLNGIDLVSIKMQEHGLEAVKGLDLKRVKPRMVLLTYGSRRREILEWVANHGYSVMLDNGHDLFMVDFQPTTELFNHLTVSATRNFCGNRQEPYAEIQQYVESDLAAILRKAPSDPYRIVIVGGYLAHEVNRIQQRLPNAEFHVFEANPKTFAQLKRRYRTQTNIQCYQCAVTDRSGRVMFHETNLDGSGSVLSIASKSGGPEAIDIGRQYSIRNTDAFEVEAITLDEVPELRGKAIDLLWIDVQGAELKVLAGAGLTLANCRAVFAEVWASATLYSGQARLHDLERYLAGFDFYLAGIGLDHKLGNGSGNALWLRAPGCSSFRNSSLVCSSDDPDRLGSDHSGQEGDGAQFATESLKVFNCEVVDNKRIVGLMAARNEEAILPQTLRAMACFTDAIVFLDDASTDTTLALVESLQRECRIERIIRKQQWLRNEPGDRNRMLQAGREIGGTHFIVLDADEMLTANLRQGDGFREQVLALQPGDRLYLVWIQLWRSIHRFRHDRSVWTWNYKDFVFCDDGRCAYRSDFIHTARSPGDLNGAKRRIDGYDAGVLHFQFVNWRNLLLKQAWYRCLERLRQPDKPAAQINARYAPSKDERLLGVREAPRNWFDGYSFFDPAVFDRPENWRREQMRQWFAEHGVERFKDLDIWDADLDLAEHRHLSAGDTPRTPPPPVEPPLDTGAAWSRIEESVAAGDYERAIQLLGAWLERQRDDRRACYILGNVCLLAGKPHLALTGYEKALAWEPDNPLFGKGWADCQAALGNWSEAFSRYRQLAVNQAENPQLLITAAHAGVAARKLPEAAELYRRVLELDPGCAEAQHNLGLIEARLAARGEPGDAREAYSRLLESFSGCSAEERTRHLARFIEDHPQLAVAHNDLGVMLIDAGKDQEAQAHLEQAIALDPQQGIWIKNLADLIWVRRQESQRAVELYTRALRLDPTDHEALAAMGSICRVLGREADARFFEEQAQTHTPMGSVDGLAEPDGLSVATTAATPATTAPRVVPRGACWVSAIVSTCNSERFMRGCLEDLEAQTIADRLEIIVVDSGSKQNERAIVDEFQQRYGNILYLRTEHRETVYSAWNRAIQISSGRYVTSANTDDRHRRDALEVMARVLDALPEVGLAYADCVITRRENETFDQCTPSGHYRWRNWNRDDLLAGHCFMGPQPMWRRSVHEQYGLFDGSLVTSGDYEFWLRISQTHLFLHIPVLLGLYLDSAGSIEHRHRQQQREENARLLSMYRQARETNTIIRRPLYGAAPEPSPGRLEPDEAAARPSLAGSQSAVSIILYAAGQDTDLSTCLGMLVAHTAQPVEVAVPESLWGSVRDIVEGAAGLGGNLQLVPVASTWPEPAYLNLAAAATHGGQVVLLSADAIVGPGWLERLQTCVNLPPATRLVCAAPRRLDAPVAGIKILPEQLAQIAAEIRSYGERHHRRCLRLARPELDCLLLERRTLERLDGFDAELTDPRSMIEDLRRRWALEGGETVCAADALVVRVQRLSDAVPAIAVTACDAKWAALNPQGDPGKRWQVLQAIQDADALGQQGKTHEASQLLLRAIGWLPQWAAGYLALAELLLRDKRHQEVLETLAELPEADRSGSAALVLAASAYEELGRLDEAEAAVRRALEASPGHAPALNCMGLIAFRRGEIDAARQCFQNAMAADPGYGEPYSNLGVLSLQQNNPEEALALQQRAFVLAPREPDIAGNYHDLAARLGRLESAETLVREALEFFPDNLKLRYFLIDILLQRGDNAAAMERVEQTIVDFGVVEDGLLAAAMALRAKLGPRRVAPERKGAGSVSVCMIVKNEERYLARCLKSLAPIADEIVVVDTGSSDRSRDIAVAFGARVFDFEWVDDFSAARNYSMDQAQGDWILIMDGDEVLSPRDHDSFRALVADRGTWPAAYLVTTRNYQRKANTIGWNPNSGEYPGEEAGFGWIPTTKVRLVSSDPRLRFHYPVHEMLDPALLQEKVVVRSCAIPVHHYGKLDEARCHHKGQAYFELGLRKLDQLGDSEIALRELATEAGLLGRHEDAVALWRRYLDLDPEPRLVAQALVNLATAHWHLGGYDEAVEAARQAARLSPEMKEARYSQAFAELHRGCAAEAVPLLQQVLQRHPSYPPARFVLCAAHFCLDQQASGSRELETLLATPMGKALAAAFHSLAKSLLNAGQEEYATRLLQAAVTHDHVNADVLKLLSQRLHARDEAYAAGEKQEPMRRAG